MPPALVARIRESEPVRRQANKFGPGVTPAWDAENHVAVIEFDSEKFTHEMAETWLSDKGYSGFTIDEDIKENSRTFGYPFTNLSGKFEKTPEGGLRVKGVKLLAAGIWTDSAQKTPCEYSPEILKQYAGNWQDNAIWSRHFGGVPRNITEKVGIVENPRFESDAVVGDLYYHGLTQQSRDTISMIENGLANYVSVETVSKDRWNVGKKLYQAQELGFTGLATVNQGACRVCKIRDNESHEHGGEGSGNFGHAGISGQVGGSAPSGGGASDEEEVEPDNGVTESLLQQQLGSKVTLSKMDTAFGGRNFWDESSVNALKAGADADIGTYSGALTSRDVEAIVVYGSIVGSWGDRSDGIQINGGKTIMDATLRPSKIVLKFKNDGDVPVTDWNSKLGIKNYEMGSHELAASVPNNPSGSGIGSDSSSCKLSLSDFTDKTWDELSSSEKSGIAKHFAYNDGSDSFGALKLPHHDPNGDIRPNCVRAALQAIGGARSGKAMDLGGKEEAVQTHLNAHLKDIDSKKEAEMPEKKREDEIVSDKGSLENLRDKIREALQAKIHVNQDLGYGPYLLTTLPDQVIYEIGGPGVGDKKYRVPYQIDESGTVTFGDPIEVTIAYQDTTEEQKPGAFEQGIEMDEKELEAKFEALKKVISADSEKKMREMSESSDKKIKELEDKLAASETVNKELAAKVEKIEKTPNPQTSGSVGGESREMEMPPTMIQIKNGVISRRG